MKQVRNQLSITLSRHRRIPGGEPAFRPEKMQQAQERHCRLLHARGSRRGERRIPSFPRRLLPYAPGEPHLHTPVGGFFQYADCIALQTGPLRRCCIEPTVIGVLRAAVKVPGKVVAVRSFTQPGRQLALAVPGSVTHPVLRVVGAVQNALSARGVLRICLELRGIGISAQGDPIAVVEHRNRLPSQGDSFLLTATR